MNLITIENKAGKVKLTDVVHQDSVTKLIQEMDLVFGAKAAANGLVQGEITNCITNAADTMDIEIHSPGGSVFEGYRAYHAILAMRQRGVYVTATINSLAASMGSVIAMAADKVRMVEGGRMMIHDVSQNIGSANAELHARAALILDGMSNEIAGIYSKKTGAKREEMRALMKQETWMDTTVSLARGFIDEVVGGDTAKNSGVDNAEGEGTRGDMSLLDRLISPSNLEAQERIVALESQISQHDGEVSELQAKLDTATTALQEAAEIQALNVTLNETVALHVATIAAKDAEIATLTEAANFTAEKVDSAAAAKLAAIGHGEPLDLGTGNVTEAKDSKQMTRAEFVALTPKKAQAFIKGGGKLTD